MKPSTIVLILSIFMTFVFFILTLLVSALIGSILMLMSGVISPLAIYALKESKKNK